MPLPDPFCALLLSAYTCDLLQKAASGPASPASAGGSHLLEWSIAQGRSVLFRDNVKTTGLPIMEEGLTVFTPGFHGKDH